VYTLITKESKSHKKVSDFPIQPNEHQYNFLIIRNVLICDLFNTKYFQQSEEMSNIQKQY